LLKSESHIGYYVSHTVLLKIDLICICLMERLWKNNFVSLIDLETYNFFKIPEKILHYGKAGI